MLNVKETKRKAFRICTYLLLSYLSTLSISFFFFNIKPSSKCFDM